MKNKLLQYKSLFYKYVRLKIKSDSSLKNESLSVINNYAVLYYGQVTTTVCGPNNS